MNSTRCSESWISACDGCPGTQNAKHERRNDDAIRTTQKHNVTGAHTGMLTKSAPDSFRETEELPSCDKLRGVLCIDEQSLIPTVLPVIFENNESASAGRRNVRKISQPNM